MARSPLIIIQTETGCLVPLNRKLNADGYYRCKVDDALEMYHRYVWRTVVGDLPSNYEIDHLCKNRACANPTHLRCIPGTQHTGENNAERAEERIQKAKEYWLETGCSIRELSKIFNVNWYTAQRWIKLWMEVHG